MYRNRIILGNKFELNKNSFPTFEFHIAKEVRKKYNFDEELFSINGNVLFANFHAVRLFVQKINSGRKVEDHVATGQMNAAGLMDEIYHYLFRLYEVQINPGVFKNALNQLEEKIGQEEIRKILFEFVSLFPPNDVYKGKSSVHDYMSSSAADKSNIEITLEELILLFFANINPANKNLIELFDENYFRNKKLYKKVIASLDSFFQKEKKFGPENQDIFTFLKTPIITNPDNIEAQLDFILEKWGIYLDEKFLQRILSSKDLIREDRSFETTEGGGAAPTAVPNYLGKIEGADSLFLGKSEYKYAEDIKKDYHELENFTKDTDWMPNVILIAKNVYVWLDQLSKKYQRHIHKLDQVPEEELDQISQWGFNGLWLIGLWERSRASKQIKHIMGNIDAVSSAYSLYDYQIARGLGGEDAYRNLNERARAHRIRLASDMVPNHTGIFSKWVIEHPDYFIQTNYPPFPNYNFSGPDLSDNPFIQLRIEDGYWVKSDAAVVFQRIDTRTGDVRYIYHGNDGTNMPWNDTAQLNMLRQDVREAVIQKIFEVARKFSIIRFDAAMTLTKRHFSRLWYPEPGLGGDIPTRADQALSKKEFDRLFPEEFWREVVDRINVEIPDTLLLAEAFWLMEGYFVRSLGMHRVYNSAFMNMLMKEENEKYRDLISNTLEFEPEILKRYVNFMSNPDEETAVKQFGSGDKYFGVCTLMVTLPGLPMFAHGQIDGFTEKYGMEYQRAYYYEEPNQLLVERHHREIFPLLKKRYLFSHVTNFWLFDFIDSYSSINENVFAFSNYEYGERAIVFYNNKYQHTTGIINSSSPKLVIQGNGSRQLETRSIAETLKLNSSPKHFYVFREHFSNLEFIKLGSDIALNGFYVELGAFKSLLYLDWREVYDESGDWEKLAWKLGYKGVPNIFRALEEMKLEPIHFAFEKMFDEESLEGFIKSCVFEGETEECKKDRIRFIDEKFSALLSSVKNHFSLNINIEPIIKRFEKEIDSVPVVNKLLDDEFDAKKNILYKDLHRAIIISRDTNYYENSILFMLWAIMSNIKELFLLEGEINQSNYFDKLMLDVPVNNILKRLGRGDQDIDHEILLLNSLNNFHIKFCSDFISYEKSSKKYNCLIDLLENEDVRIFLGVNEYEGILYYSKENFEELMSWLFTLSILEQIQKDEKEIKADKLIPLKEKLLKSFGRFQKVLKSSNLSEYKIESLKENLVNYEAATNL